MSFYLATFASRQFRNLAGSPFQLHPRFNVFFGENGQGKTNLLEAIYYLFTLRPLRPVRPKDLMAWGMADARVQGDVQGRVLRKLAVTFSRNKRQITVNGAPPLQLDDYFDGTHVVAFTPEEIQLVRGAPELRRRFLDRAVFNTDITYLREVRQFLRILSHRNALLKQDNIDSAFLDVINQQFVELGVQIITRRIALLSRLRVHMKEAYARIFPDLQIDVEMHYQSSIRELPKLQGDRTFEELTEEVTQRFVAYLQRVRTRELDRRKTMLGPQQDDIAFVFGGKPFKQTASQGQTRALVLALKIAEIREIEMRTQQAPLLLLDDVAGELDPRHSAYFFQFLEETDGQVLLTTTDLDYIRLPDIQLYPRFRLEKGEIH
ncbi:MAG TPA: DNA replication and repair protein RecF [Myxococcales bacterium]|nr:DNA replication and repair protein RecF [Deltaproteobacteria bacterium]MBU48395.1 DNA replication and repair protein RecF [Deltaproteobacteria bacterium]HAA57717.1 DNA replication and repair protein RecF [Myxococcales bacterium]|tara:strand:- start:8595 stop:9725 length:1131 start_codon:yes stop_codon:yes gene_type:complete